MGIRYAIRPPLLEVVTEGDVDYVEGLGIFQEALRVAADRGQGWHVLFDIRGSRENRSADELAGIADVVAQHRGLLSGRCAVVADDDLHYGLGRVFSGYAGGKDITVEVFRDIDSARAYLGSDAPPA